MQSKGHFVKERNIVITYKRLGGVKYFHCSYYSFIARVIFII